MEHVRKCLWFLLESLKVRDQYEDRYREDG